MRLSLDLQHPSGTPGTNLEILVGSWASAGISNPGLNQETCD
jgi:hypothetical protein